MEPCEFCTTGTGPTAIAHVSPCAPGCDGIHWLCRSCAAANGLVLVDFTTAAGLIAGTA